MTEPATTDRALEEDTVTDQPYGPATAVIVVDMQVDFGDPSGSLYVQGGEDVVAPVNALTDEVVRAGGKAYFTQDWHPAQTPHFVTQGGTWPPHGVAGTPGAELLAGLVVNGPVVQKGVDGRDGYSGFSVRDPRTGATEATVLGDWLHRDGAERVIVVGLAGDYCVVETALDAADLGFQVEMPLALTRFVRVAEGDDVQAVERARAAGVRVEGALA
ncbi:MAG: isochorismatase hydrolase [Frankiales bacterium]|nr:isochorismatase hydrolase [Frankiales bacterium]